MERATEARSREMARVWKRSVRARVFVAGDDAALRNLVVWALLDDGHEVYEAASGEELLSLMGAPDGDHAPSTACEDRCPTCGVDLIVLDHRMPVVDGLGVARTLRRAQWGVPLIMMTSFPSAALRSEALALHVHLLAKPFSLRALSDSALSLLLTETTCWPSSD
jgi:two-component system, cell cycle response regulator CpdR